MIGKIFISHHSSRYSNFKFEKIKSISIMKQSSLHIIINDEHILLDLKPLDKQLKIIIMNLIEEFKDKEFIEQKDIINSKTIKDLKK